VLHLEGRRHRSARSLNPQYVDEPDGVGAGKSLQRGGKHFQTTVAKTPALIRPVPIVGGNPHVVTKRAAQIP
jgi:hypothetical protein